MFFFPGQEVGFDKNWVVVSNIIFFFNFHPYIWGNDPILTSIFFKGVETTN